MPERRVHEADLRAIWQAHGLGDFRSAVPAARGSRNESYIVDDALVIRFNTLDPQFPKFRNERIAYDLLARSVLPVPSVAALDESRSIVRYDFMPTDTREAMLPGSETSFVEGYRSVRPLDAGLDRRVALYLVFLSLETAVMDDAQGDQPGAIAAVADLRDRLARYAGQPSIVPSD